MPSELGRLQVPLFAFMKGRPVTDVELFVLVLYTGTEAQGQIRRALRQKDGSAEEWRWTTIAIRHAVIKLAEDPPESLYHGLNGVRLSDETLVCNERGTLAAIYGTYYSTYFNLISGSMDEDIARDFAAGAGGTVASPSTVGTVLCFCHWDSCSGSPMRMGFAACADLRWISKFPYEQEWLMVPVGRGCYLSYDGRPGGEAAATWEEWKGCTLTRQNAVWREVDPCWGLAPNFDP